MAVPPRTKNTTSSPFLTTAEGSVLVPLHAREGRSSVLRSEQHRVSRSLSRDAQRRLSRNTDSLNAMVLHASSTATAALVQQAQDLPDPVRRSRVKLTKARDADSDFLIYEYEQKHHGHNQDQDDDDDSEGEAAVDDDVVLAKPVHRISSSSSIPRLAGYTMVHATLDEFQDTFGRRPLSPHDPLHDDMAERELLFTLTEAIHKRITIQRLVLQPRGMGTSTRRRDFVVVQCQKRFRLPDGRQGWVQSLHSVDVPTHHKDHDCVRAKIHRSGVVAIDSAVHKKTLDVVVTAQVDLHGNASRGAYRAVSKRRVTKVMAALQRALVTHRVETLSFPGTHRFLEIEFEQKDRTCRLCHDKLAWLTIPGWISARHTCRKCGATVCGACSHVWTIERQRTTTLVGGGRVTTATRVCNQCVVTNEPPHKTLHGKHAERTISKNALLRHRQDPHRTSDRSASLFGNSHALLHRAPSTSTGSDRMRPTQLEFHLGSDRLFHHTPAFVAAVAEEEDEDEEDEDEEDEDEDTCKTIHLKRWCPLTQRHA